jgi:hypothetical protein
MHYARWGVNVGITWISWGAAPGYINIAPLGLEDGFPRALPQAILISPRWGLKVVILGYERFLKKSNLFFF